MCSQSLFLIYPRLQLLRRSTMFIASGLSSGGRSVGAKCKRDVGFSLLTERRSVEETPAINGLLPPAQKPVSRDSLRACDQCSRRKQLSDQYRSRGRSTLVHDRQCLFPLFRQTVYELRRR